MAGWILKPTENEDQPHLKQSSCYYSPRAIQYNNYLDCTIYYIQSRDSYKYTQDTRGL